jgi:hypothetical protein
MRDTFTVGSITGSLTVSASVEPSGTPLTYQWDSNTSELNVGGTAIGGATGASFPIPTSLAVGSYYYFCEVGANGAESKRSNATTVTVMPADVRASGVTVEPKSATVEIGATLALNAKVTPSDATNPAVEWDSNEPDVAKVDTNGLVMAIGGGTAIITVTTVDGGFTDTCTITVPASTIVDPEFPSDKGDVADVTGIDPDDLEERDGKVYLKKEAAERIAKEMLNAEEVLTYILPVFNATVLPGGVAEISFTISGKDLLAPYPNEINLLGLIFGGGAEFFEYDSRPIEFGNGKFTLLFEGAIYNGKIDPKGTYELVVFIKDGGIFDLDGLVNGKVISSIFLASVKKSGGDGGNGGCNAYYGYLTLAFVPFVLRRRSK